MAKANRGKITSLSKVKHSLFAAKISFFLKNTAKNFNFYDFFIAFFRRAAVTVITVSMVAIIAYTPQFLNYFTDVIDITDILVAASSILGTILVLTFSLIIIPIQKASETFSMSIFKMYTEDKRNQSAFIFISITIVSLFLLVAMDISKGYKLFLSLITLGVILDWARYYYHYVANLLDPKNAVSSIVEKAKFDIYKDESIGKNCDDAIKGLIYELTEIASKAVNRREISLARTASNAIAEIAHRYVYSKKKYFSKENAGVAEKVYSSLLQINRDATEANDRETALNIINIYIRFIQFSKKIGVIENNVLLDYIYRCIKNAEGEESDEIVIEGTEFFLKAAKILPDRKESDIYLFLIDCMRDIVYYFLHGLNFNASNIVAGRIIELLAIVFIKTHPEKIDIFSYSLMQLAALIQPAVNYEIKKTGQCLRSPLSSVYSIKSSTWIGNIAQEKGNNTAEFARLICQHLKDIYKKTQFDKNSSKMKKEILETIDHLSCDKLDTDTVI